MISRGRSASPLAIIIADFAMANHSDDYKDPAFSTLSLPPPLSLSPFLSYLLILFNTCHLRHLLSVSRVLKGTCILNYKYCYCWAAFYTPFPPRVVSLVVGGRACRSLLYFRFGSCRNMEQSRASLRVTHRWCMQTYRTKRKKKSNILKEYNEETVSACLHSREPSCFL